MTTYRATYGHIGSALESEIPTVVVELGVGKARAEQFFLMLSDEAKIKDPVSDGIVLWGDFRKTLAKPLDDPHRKDFWVAVVEEVWRLHNTVSQEVVCTAQEVVEQIETLNDKIRRRNWQINDLREENKKLRERLATLGENVEPARS